MTVMIHILSMYITIDLQGKCKFWFVDYQGEWSEKWMMKKVF